MNPFHHLCKNDEDDLRPFPCCKFLTLKVIFIIITRLYCVPRGTFSDNFKYFLCIYAEQFQRRNM